MQFSVFLEVQCNHYILNKRENENVNSIDNHEWFTLHSSAFTLFYVFLYYQVLLLPLKFLMRINIFARTENRNLISEETIETFYCVKIKNQLKNFRYTIFIDLD